MSTDTQVQNVVTRDIDWARHHLFLLLAVGVLVIGSIYGIESILARRAHDQHVEDMALLAQMQKANEQTQATTQKQIDTLTQQNANLQTQLTGLSASIVARDAQLFKDRQDIKTLPPSQLATKWGAAANEAAPTISTNGDFDVPLPLAQKSVDALIQVPVLSKDNTDLKASLTAEMQIATNNQTKFEDEKKAHTSDNDTCKQTIVTKDAEIKDVKAQARKRNILIAIISAVIGYGLHR